MNDEPSDTANLSAHNPMKPILVILAVLLVVSNGFWLYHSLDNGITATYREVSLQENQEALAQALQIINAAQPAISRNELIKAAQVSTNFAEPFEKDGYLWIGRLGFRLSDEGILLEAVPAWH